MNGFKFPDFYDYPPFWTKQANEEIFEKQAELWSSLICSFCKAINKKKIEINTALDSPLFTNAKIKRHLSKETLMAILEYMEKNGRARFISDRTNVIIYWVKIEEWAKILFDFGKKYGNVPYTFRGLIEGTDISDNPFRGMEYETFLEVVQYLEKEGKAIHKNKDKASLPEHGVKILA